MQTSKRHFKIFMIRSVCMHIVFSINAYVCTARLIVHSARYKMVKQYKKALIHSSNLKMHPVAIYSFIKPHKSISTQKYKRSVCRSSDLLLLLCCLKSFIPQEYSL